MRVLSLAVNTGRILLALILLAAVVSCSDTAGPGEPAAGTPAGIHVLETANAAPLPAVVFDGHVSDQEGGFHLRVVAIEGVLELKANGRYEHTMRHHVYIDGVLSAQPRWTDRGPWVAGATSVSFASDYIEDVAFTGTRGPDRLDISQDHVGEGVPAQYRYVKGVIAF